MAVSRIPLHVEMEDGTAYDVVIDQRDIAKWELQPFYDDDRTTLRQRYAAFAALVRGKVIELSWPKFNDACVEVIDGRGKAEDVDPTQPDPSGEA